MSVEASIVVQFGTGITGGSNDIVVVEFDDKHPNNLNADKEVKSTFDPDDQPVILVHYASHLKITDVKTTAGNVGEIGQNIVRERKDSSLFTKLDSTNSFSYVTATGLTQSWYGNKGVAVINKNQLELSGGTTPCYGDFTFKVNFNKQYMLIPPALNLKEDETYPIYIVIYIDAV
jgi:hypothetical protein